MVTRNVIGLINNELKLVQVCFYGTILEITRSFIAFVCAFVRACMHVRGRVCIGGVCIRVCTFTFVCVSAWVCER